jgi:hypothetical protein
VTAAAALVASSEYTSTPSIAIPRQQQTKPMPNPYAGDEVSESEEESDFEADQDDEEQCATFFRELVLNGL